MLNANTTLVVLGIATSCAAVFAFFHYVVWSPLPKPIIKWVVLGIFVGVFVLSYVVESAHGAGYLSPPARGMGALLGCRYLP